MSDLPEERAVNHESAETTDGAAAASKTASGTVTTAATTLTSTLDDGQQSGGSFFRQALDELIPVNEAGSSLTESSYKTDSEPISFPSDSVSHLQFLLQVQLNVFWSVYEYGFASTVLIKRSS